VRERYFNNLVNFKHKLIEDYEKDYFFISDFSPLTVFTER
jgi:hypothetical protein